MAHSLREDRLSAEGLTLWRGTRCLFDALSFEVRPGNALLVQGANGSGKTTLLRILCGLTRPESGRVLWSERAIDSEYWAQLAYNGHLPGLKADLTVAQNLDFFAAARGATHASWRDRAAQLGLSHCEDLEVRHLSAGQKRRTALVRLLISGAKVWILDEPFTNLDQQGREMIERALNEHVNAGGLAVIAAHHALQVADSRLQHLTLGALN